MVKFEIMKTGTYNIDLGFDQILDLVRQLPRKEKIRLSKELERVEERLLASIQTLAGAAREDEKGTL